MKTAPSAYYSARDDEFEFRDTYRTASMHETMQNDHETFPVQSDEPRAGSAPPPPLPRDYDTQQSDEEDDIHPATDCDLRTVNYYWTSKTHFVADRYGDKYIKRYTLSHIHPVSKTRTDVYTFVEGQMHNSLPVESKYPALCGEMVSHVALPPVHSLSHVSAPVSHDYVFNEDTGCAARQVPMYVNKSHLVLVFRTYREYLAIQLMPSIYFPGAKSSSVLPGTPLFVENRVCGAVGSAFAEFSYVANGTPNHYTLLSVDSATKKDKHDDTERMQVIVLDRRTARRMEVAYEYDSPKSIKAVSEIVAPVFPLLNDHRNAKIEHDEIVYLGSVNRRMQLVDVVVPSGGGSEKVKHHSRNVATIVIDDRGVSAFHIVDKNVVHAWYHRDPTITYSLLPRSYYDAPVNVLESNQMIIGKRLRASKSQERLI